MDQPISAALSRPHLLGGDWRSKATMLLQNRDTLRYARVTDMCGCARHKTSDGIGLAAAE
jgi:hypothetical protein